MGRKRSRVDNSKKWNPKVWKPVYETIVAKSILGVSNKKLALDHGYTEVQISNIVNSDEAKIIKEMHIAKVRESVGDLAANLESRALTNIQRVLESDKLLEKNPFQMLSASMEYLKGMGKMKTGKESEKDKTTVQNTFILSGDAQDKFVEAMSKSDEVMKRLYPTPVETIKTDEHV